MMLFVFTSDDGEREDGSVHYAGYLLVDVNKAGDLKKYNRVVAIINAAMDDDGNRELVEIQAELKAIGIRSNIFDPQFVYCDEDVT